MNILRNSLAVVLGVVIGGLVNYAFVYLGPSLISPPAGVDVGNADSIAQSTHLFEPKHFLFPFLAHAIGTMVGAGVAYLVAVNRPAVFAYAIGAIFLMGGIAAAQMIPAPTWFLVVDLGLAYIPMAWLGILIAQRIKT